MKRKTKTKTKRVSNKLDNENSCPENGSESVMIDNHSIADTLSEEQNSRSQDMDNDFYVPNIDSSDIDSTDSYYESQSAVVAIAKPINDYNNNNFNENEMHFVSELLSAIKHMKRNLVAITVWEPTNFDDFFRPLMHKNEESISSFVKTCKSLKAFKDICERDQMTLFKSGGIEALTFHRYTRFDYDNDWWKVVMDNGNALILRLDLLKQHRFETVYPMSKKVLNSIKHTLDLDFNIIYLLLPIMIFNPNKTNLVHPEIVRFQQQLYMFLLQRYLRIRYGSECDIKLAQILNIIQDIRQLTDIHNQDTRLKDPKLLGPLLREVLDIELPPVDQYSLTAL
ncbi:unnamed protein product [Oppiella nova]|uniref:NR LBD domain-containing protein n=1 Tax=Oppiella nova TaxID=334625 RepID=A0A7R9M8Z4_9ACAR|nr:unnamed protein product [Oppiella nova]CAG2173029.1 unnamed protein product [Oppiella nova]